MKKSILILAVTMFIAGAMFSGCQSSADKVQDARDNVETANQELDQAVKDSIREFKKESEAKISNYDQNIAELKAKIATMNKENKARYEKMLADLEQRNNLLKKKLADLKDDGVDQWAAFKREFNHDMDEIGKALKDLTIDNKK
jgi:septal ring factor EnvC (AmiA/AmiB activator)